MLACPVCGFRNPDSNERCFRCQALLGRNQDEFERSESRAQSRLNRDQLRNVWARPLEWLTRRKWIRNTWAIPDTSRHKFPFTAGLLTIILPGSGHFYLNQRVKAFLFFFAWLAVVGLCLFTLKQSWNNYLLLFSLILMAAMWADAVVSANVINGHSLPFRHGVALGFAFLFFAGVFAAALQFFGSNIISFTKLMVDEHPGEMVRGDRILVNHWAYLFKSPKPGDLVLYDPQRFTIQKGEDLTSVNIERYFQRIVGGPGDHVQKAGRTYYRNGVSLNEVNRPISGDFLPDFDLTVPAGSYFIPVTTITPGMGPALISGAPIGYVGEPGSIFAGWPATALVKSNEIMGKALAIIDPPTHRRWL